jgi:uncharacterized protein YbaP (TraB family)
MTSLPSIIKRSMSAPLVALLLALSTHPARADDSCPALPKPPTEQQVREGMAQARDRGLLWRLERDGRVSWLYGTVHVGRAEWIYPGPTLLAALADSATLALELDITDPAVAQAMTQLPPGVADQPLTSGQRRRLQIQAASACVPIEQLAPLHPVLQITSVSASINRRQGLDPIWAQELILTGIARSMGKPIASLETAASQLAALLPTDPAEARREVDEGLDQMEDGRASRLLNRLVRDWEAGDLADLTNYSQWCDCVLDAGDRAAMHKLLDERNPALADGIARLHESGSVFAAVGAMHMTGPLALPTLLQRQGFVVTPVLPAPASRQPTQASAKSASKPASKPAKPAAKTVPVTRTPVSDR